MLIVAITAHYVDETFELQKDLLDFQEVSVAHFSVNLTKHVLEVLEKYNIHDRLYCITTDNASNNDTMVTALKQLLAEKGIIWNAERNHIPCLAHVINLAVKNFLNALKIQSQTSENKWEVLEFKARSLSSKDSWQKYKIDSNNPFGRAIQKIRKISYLINWPPSHLKSFQDMCKMVDIVFMCAIKDVATQWNSTHNMLARAVYLRKAIDTWIRMNTDYVNLILRDDEWTYVEFLVHFLAPFYWTTQLLQFTSIPTLQQTFETYESLFNSLDNVKGLFENITLKPTWIADVESGMIKMWNKLWLYYSEAKSYVYCDAILLHSLEKTRWFKRWDWSSEIVTEYQQFLKRRLKIEYKDDEQENLKRSFATMISNESESNSDTEPESEFDIYMSYSRQSVKKQKITNPLNWWKQSRGMFPSLACMAQDTYAVPVTGSEVKREFSISGNLVKKRRNRLNPKTISDLMQYKRWLARTGVLAKLKLENDEIIDEESGNENDEEKEELNQKLIDWLNKWKQTSSLKDRADLLSLQA